MDTERLRWALRDALISRAERTDPDDLDDIIEFLASECMSSGLCLPLAGEDTSSEKLDSHGRTLEDLLAHPLTAIVGPHLVDLLAIEEGQVAILVDNVLDAYEDGPAAIAEEYAQQRGEVKLCDLCERPTALTEHHLIPRTEHELCIKRGLFTADECRTRITMLCRPCHSAVHRAKTTRELAREFNTLDKLLEIPEVTRFAEWNSKRKVAGTVPQKRGKYR